jgi:hypothetical protein
MAFTLRPERGSRTCDAGYAEPQHLLDMSIYVLEAVSGTDSAVWSHRERPWSPESVFLFPWPHLVGENQSHLRQS